jgi:hypothetical protein
MDRNPVRADAEGSQHGDRKGGRVRQAKGVVDEEEQSQLLRTEQVDREADANPVAQEKRVEPRSAQ